MRTPRRIEGGYLVLVIGASLLTASPTLAALASWKTKPPTVKPRVVPPATTLPLVVQTPMKPIDTYKPPMDIGVFPAETMVPEPTSLVTGMVGGGCAIVAWLKRRYRRAVEADKSNEVEETLSAS